MDEKCMSFEVWKRTRANFEILTPDSNSTTQKTWESTSLVHQATLSFGKGHESTSITSSFAMLMLASHPEIQDQVYEEIYNIYGSEDPKDFAVKFEDLRHFIILERVIKETMRIFPITPVIVRNVNEDLDIENFTLPKNSVATIFVWKLHRDENIWPDPLKFNSDRFLPEEVAKRHPYSFIPFSAGPRNCMGFTYAMMIMKIILITVLRRYILKKDNVEPIEHIRVKIDLGLQAVESIQLRLENRI